MKKFTVVIMALLMLFALASCGGKDEETTTTQALADEETTTVAETETTEAVTEETTTEVTTEQEKSKVPVTDEEILAAYTLVMNKAKTDKVGFTLAEWQSLPDDENSRVISKGTAVVGASLNVANNFMTTEKDAKAKPAVYEKGGDMATFPIRNTPYGCTLTDPADLRSISAKELKDGNVEIILVLKDEMNPEPAPAGTGNSPSTTGKVITPISKKEIDENINGSIVSAVCKDIKYSLLFHDVTSTVVYNPETNEIVSLKQVTKVTVSGSGKVAGLEIVVDKQELINNKEITNLKY